MTAPLVAYTAIAGQRDFDVPFPYLNLSHVEVRVNSILVPILEWVSQSRLRLSAPPGAGSFVEIRRNTPIDDALVNFQNGAVLTEEDLNTAILQLLYKQQEVTALYDASLVAAQVRLAAANGIPVDPEDVANQLANLVLEDQVLANFRQRIADIDALAITGSLQAGTIEDIAQNIADPLGNDTGLKAVLNSLRSDHELLSSIVDGLLELGDGDGIATVISNEASARIAGDTALAATIALIGAKSNDNNAFILDLNKIKVSPTESLANRLTTLAAADAATNAAITNEQNARTSALAAEATSRQQLGAALQSAINNEAATRAAAIATEQTTRATEIAAEAANRQSLGVSLTNTINGVISNTAASVNQEATARAAADNVIAETVALIGAKSPDGTAFILDESKVKISNGTSLGVRLSGIDTAVGNVTAAVVNEQNARASADSALSNSINVVSTNVGNLSASVSTLSLSVDGVRARYGVSLNVNGYVTGFIQNNNGSSGSFDILADRFRVVAPGFTPKTVFDVTAQGITMNANVTINGNLIVNGSISSTQLSANAATAGGYFFNASAVPMSTSWQTAASVTLPMIGGAAKVDFCCYVAGQGYANGTNVLYRLLRNGTEIRQGNLCLIYGEQTVYAGGNIGENPQSVYQPVASMFPFFLIDTAGGSGSVTYTVQLRTPANLYFYCDFAERQMSVTEFRR
jgi:hypothetical protein